MTNEPSFLVSRVSSQLPGYSADRWIYESAESDRTSLVKRCLPLSGAKRDEQFPKTPDVGSLGLIPSRPLGPPTAFVEISFPQTRRATLRDRNAVPDGSEKDFRGTG